MYIKQTYQPPALKLFLPLPLLLSYFFPSLFIWVIILLAYFWSKRFLGCLDRTHYIRAFSDRTSCAWQSERLQSLKRRSDKRYNAVFTCLSSIIKLACQTSDCQYNTQTCTEIQRETQRPFLLCKTDSVWNFYCYIPIQVRWVVASV